MQTAKTEEDERIGIAVTRFQRFLWNALLMTGASLCIRAVGVLFNRYLTHMLGAAGLGRFSLIMSVYGLAVTLASSGIHLAVTRVAAEEAGGGRYRGVRAAVKTGLLYSLFFGLLSGVLLFSFAEPIAAGWLRDAEAAPALRLLALSLPPLALSTVLNGYFIAVRRASRGAAVNVLGQTVRICATVFLLRLLLPRGAVWSCIAMVGGCVVSEFVSFLLSAVLALPFFRRDRLLAQDEPPAPTRSVSVYLLRIAVPIALTTYIRSGLLTLEHLLIPAGLESSGTTAEAALAAYGTVHGMVMPVILFPAAFLAAFSGLLIPEIAEYRSKNAKKTVIRTACRVLRVTLLFSTAVSGGMICWAYELGTVLCGSSDAGLYIRALAPLIPVMYLDTMVDAMLKGLDQQVASMRYNIMDTALSVAMAYFLLPRSGIRGYIFLLYASEIFNFSLSLGRLLSVTGLRFRLIAWVGKPVFSVIGASVLSALSFRLLGEAAVFRFPLVTLAVHLLFTLMLYCGFLAVTGCVGGRELRMFLDLLRGKEPEEFALDKPQSACYNKSRTTTA